jgi:hypothetical protein
MNGFFALLNAVKRRFNVSVEVPAVPRFRVKQQQYNPLIPSENKSEEFAVRLFCDLGRRRKTRSQPIGRATVAFSEPQMGRLDFETRR